VPTTARRHAPGAAVDVELTYGEDMLRVAVRNSSGGGRAEERDAAERTGVLRALGARLREIAFGGEAVGGPAVGGRRLGGLRIGATRGIGGVRGDQGACEDAAAGRGTARWPAGVGASAAGTSRAGASGGGHGLLGMRERAAGTPDPDGDASPDRGPRIVMLTTFDLDEHVYDALAAGASGFLLKDMAAERLFDAVRVVAAGEALLAPTVTRRLIGQFVRIRPPAAGLPAPLAALTPRETETLRLVAEGLSNAEIADRLVVSAETVKTHVSRVLTKLAARDRAQAIVLAYEYGLVVPGHRSA
jgi:DNA-binding NarL/FixJ family response regulator